MDRIMQVMFEGLGPWKLDERSSREAVGKPRVASRGWTKA